MWTMHWLTPAYLLLVLLLVLLNGFFVLAEFALVKVRRPASRNWHGREVVGRWPCAE